MIFESMWPLLFLAAIPVIIILYLLKPKGQDHRISSNLLWQQLLRNQESKTFLEKFVHNILMYVQILIIALLIIALMSPFIHTEGQGGGRVTLLLDTSASMQHKGDKGKTRLEEAVDTACDYVRSRSDTRFSVVTHDNCGTRLLAVDLSDRDAVVKILKGIRCSDAGGDLAEAQSLLSTLSEGEEEDAGLVIFSDHMNGEWDTSFAQFAEISYQTVGETVSNVSNDYLAFRKKDDLYDVVLSVTNHAESSVTMDVSLYGDKEDLLCVRQLTLDAGENATCLFEQVDWQGSTLKSVLSGFTFADGEEDSLEMDNVSYAVRDRAGQTSALLVGSGNTFVEKAYRAATGEQITKAENDAPAMPDNFDLVIYDRGETPSAEYFGNRMRFAPKEEGAEELSNVVLSVDKGDLTAGLSNFTVGVNKAYCYELPEGAIPFLEYQGKCVGYYGEQNGYREVVLGFDIRESDFPLRAEFPVFMANVINYLADSSWLGSNVYYAGETLLINPWAEMDRTSLDPSLSKAGLFTVGNEDYRESFVVRPAIATESDGHVEESGDTVTGQLSRQKTRRTLRNLFLILALVLLAVEWVLYVKQMRYRGKFYLAVRLTVTACLVAALFGVQISRGSGKNATVFVVDMSNSNREHLEEMSAYLGDMIAEMPKNSRYGIVTFGGNTLVEQFLTEKHLYAGLMTLPDKNATNLEEALSRALTMIPSDVGGRVVLLTDGRQTRGDIRNMATALTTGKVELLSLVYEVENKPDVYVEDVEIPTYLHPGDVYSITVQVVSNYDTDARIQLMSGSSEVSSGEVHLNKGSNRFVFRQQVTDESLEKLRVQVSAPGDSCAENDSYSVCAVVEAPPKILVISGRRADTAPFSAMLSAAGCDYNVVSALNAPATVKEMLEYRSIVLVNTFIDDLPGGFVDQIESYVRDYGGGFVCCGGEDSFALGGYRNSPLEAVLPVDMQLRSDNEIPTMTMVMVIDRSGSMSISEYDNGGPTNLDLAIRSAAVAVDNLRDEDYVGILTFDDGFEWQVELTQAKDKNSIKEQLEDIPDGGGTTIKPALEEAGRKVSKSKTTMKHVVLLTDGMGETKDFSDVIKEYTDAGITLSTVAVGNSSDTQLLEQLARSCGGRYYFSDHAADIPKIFAQEVFLGSDSYIRNGDFPVAVYGGHELTRGLFAEGWPNLYGYIASSPKTGSQMIVASADKEDPILTVWQYGLGHTVAWNTDVSNEWSGGYAGKEDYLQLWKRILDYSTGSVGLGEDSVDVVSAGGSTSIVYTTDNYDGKTGITAYYVDPDGNTGEVALHATAPGYYEAEFTTEEAGIYNLHVRRSDGETVTNTFNTAAVVQFSDEYKFDNNNAVFLNFLEKYGEQITENDNIWNRRVIAAREKQDLTNLLLAIAVLLFLADIAVRRFQYVPKWDLRRVRSAKVQPGSDGAESAKSESADAEPAHGSGMQVESKTENAPSGKKQKAAKRPKKEKKPAEETLDTSQLLKKKDERNI